ncbi:DNA mismatch repair MutL/HexB family protein [Abortiporus biennis]
MKTWQPPLLQNLPPQTQSRLRSTQILTSLPQIISELVQNSLDANARNIEIGLDCEQWECWVRDDGCGISRDGLSRIGSGSQEGRYNTSKAYSPGSLDDIATFGFRGEALASAADVSCVEISSRTARSRDSWSIILKGGDNLYSGSSLRWRRDSPGTTVCIRDAFYNLPVRRRSHPSPQRTIELIRREVEVYGLMFPQVSFSLENAVVGRDGRPDRVRILSIPKTQTTLAAFRHIFGKALATHVDEIDVSEGDVRIEGFISLEGAQSKSHQFLYLNRHPLSQCDLHRIIDSKFTSSSFAKHAFDEQGETSRRSATRRSPRKTEKKPVYVLNINLPSKEIDNCLEPAKAIVHFRNQPAVSSLLSSTIQSFLVKHGFAHSTIPITMQERRILRGQGGTEQDFAPSPRKRKRRKICYDDEEDEGVKSLGPSFSDIQLDRNEKEQDLVIYQSDNDEPQFNDINIIWTDPKSGQAFVVDKRTDNSYPLDQGPTTMSECDDINVNEDDSEEKKEQRRNLKRRTLGFEKKRRWEEVRRLDSETPAWIREAFESNEAYHLLEPQIPTIRYAQPLPLQSSNPTFPSQAQSQSQSRGHHHRDRWQTMMNTAIRNQESNFTRFERGDLENAIVLAQVDRKFVACIVDVKHDDEQEEEELNDDDNEDIKRSRRREGGEGGGGGERKPGKNSKTLVLIDQHAADERIRVEKILKELCLGFLNSPFDSPGGLVVTTPNQNMDAKGVEKRKLNPPVPVLLTRYEVTKIRHSEEIRAVLRRWGFEVSEDVSSTSTLGDREEFLAMGSADRAKFPSNSQSSEAEYGQVLVQYIPEIFADKLLTGDELRDVIKGYLVHVETTGYYPDSFTTSQIRASQSNDDNSVGQEDRDDLWQRALRWCPKELLDLANSKACRGAIMFNDPLRLEQCERLVDQLSRTSFPFQCAHGRPSLVPLTSLSTPTTSGNTNQGGVYRSRHISSEVDWGGFLNSSQKR